MSEPKAQYVQYLFWRLDSVYHSLESNERIVAKQHFLGTWESFQNKAFLTAYALTGLRVDCDILCLRVADSLELLQDMTSRLQSSGMGKFLIPTYSFLARAAGPRFTAKASGATEFTPGQGRYLFVSPWARGPEWFALAPAEREKSEGVAQEAAAHAKVRLHPGLRALDEVDELTVAEADEPLQLLDFSSALKQARRETHSQAGPAFLCVLKDIRDQVDSLG